MVNALREKIQSVLSTLDRYQNDNVYFRVARDNAPLPFIVFFTIGENNGSDTEDVNLDYNIQFSFHDVMENAALISDDVEEAKELMTMSNLASITGYRLNWVKNLNGGEPLDVPGIYHKYFVSKISLKKGVT